MEIILHSNFAFNHDLNYDVFREEDLHTRDIGLRQLAKGFLLHVRLKKNNILCS